MKRVKIAKGAALIIYSLCKEGKEIHCKGKQNYRKNKSRGIL